MLPLDGITVLSIEQAVAAPFATRQLADLGARVIKIERPGEGDFARHYDDKVKGLASYFAWLNRTKESVTLDLKHADSMPILEMLLDRADVFVQNLGPGATARLGLGAEQVRARRPSLIVCDLSGYGSSGPYRDKPAYDFLIQCEAGLVSITGSAESPAKVGISIADISAGMYAFSAVITALYHRQVTGEGASCEISLFDSLVEWMSHPMYYTMYGGSPPPRAGTAHSSIAPYGSFSAGDAQMVQVGVQNDREWHRFCREVLERPDLLDDPRFATNSLRVDHRPELTRVIEDAFSAFTAAQLVARFDAAGIANARLNDVRQLIDHPQLSARQSWTEIGSPAGPIRALRPPMRIKGMEGRMGPIPALGEHTDSVLSELGVGPDEVARLRENGVV